MHRLSFRKLSSILHHHRQEQEIEVLDKSSPVKSLAPSCESLAFLPETCYESGGDAASQTIMTMLPSWWPFHLSISPKRAPTLPRPPSGAKVWDGAHRIHHRGCKYQTNQLTCLIGPKFGTCALERSKEVMMGIAGQMWQAVVHLHGTYSQWLLLFSRLSYRNKINREEVHRTVMDLRPSSSGHVS